MSKNFFGRAALLASLAFCGLSQAQQGVERSLAAVDAGSEQGSSATPFAQVIQDSGQVPGQPLNVHSTKVMVPEGTDVRLRMLDKLSSATATEGQRFNLELEDDVTINGVMVIPHGAKAVGTVVSAKKKGFMGRGGDLNILIDYLLYKDQRIRLRASSGREGKDKVGTAVTLTVLFGPLGLLKRGHDAEINPGAILGAYVDQSTAITL